MDYVYLGNTGIKVSRICFGALTIGPLQANLSISEGAGIINHALGMGISFIDTAEIYGTYMHIGKAIEISGKRPVIATKTYAYNRSGARRSIEKARKETGLDVIDIFLLHEQESVHTLRGHREALEFLCEAKAGGMVRAVGVSTHNIQVVRLGAEMNEIDIIHPIVNKQGIGIGDGTIDEMIQAVKYASSKGKGIYTMKALGGGNLIGSYEESLNFVLDIPEVHSITIGMQAVEEVEANVAFFENRILPEDIKDKLQRKTRKLHIEEWCEKCGKCIKRCKAGALKLGNETAEVDMNRCKLCGYCGSVCPQFAIKVI